MGRRSLPVLMIGICLCGVAACGFELASERHVAPIVVTADEPEYVRLAAEDLASDVQRITGRRPDVVSGSAPSSGKCVFIGTRAGGPWESYRVEEREGRLYIEGGDARGTMFGIYAFIEKYLKVDPLGFWSGREPEKREALRWDSVSLVSGSPAFKFRGWFINDEDLLTEWLESGGSRNIDYPYYAQVVNRAALRAVAEALVRCRFNLIIPASFIDILNPPEAALVEECVRRGVFVSQHHVEPMGVSAFAYFNYWKARGKELKYSYFSHPEAVREVWRVYAEKWAAYPNVIWQLGLRGVADRPMWMADPKVPQSDEDRGRLISEAMAEQVKILDGVCARQPRYFSTTLWAEGAVLNQKGLLTIPEGTMIVFADNSPGWKWQQDFYSTPRNPNNAYGVYYHHGLIGCGPHLAQAVSPHKTYDLLRTAVDKGSNAYAIFNVGNIREFVLGLQASADMTWKMEGFDPDAWLSEWVARYFPSQQGAIENAYKIYFNAYQIHDRQQVPFLMDGQMFDAGRKALAEMSKKLKARSIGTGVEPETIRTAKVGEKVAVAAEAVSGMDAFHVGLSDMHPASLGRRETIKRAAAQRAGFLLAALAAHAGAASLSAQDLTFLQDNLLYPSDLMSLVSAWLENLLVAHEALDAGDREACVRALSAAEAAFAKIPVLAEGYCHDKWSNWYRGCKKLNVSANLKRTREVLELARESGK